MTFSCVWKLWNTWRSQCFPGQTSWRVWGHRSQRLWAVNTHRRAVRGVGLVSFSLLYIFNQDSVQLEHKCKKKHLMHCTNFSLGLIFSHPVTSPAAGQGCWCSSRWLAGQSRRWTGYTTGSLRSTPCSTPSAGDPAQTHAVTCIYLLLGEKNTEDCFFSFVLFTIRLLRGSLASLTPLMSNRRTCRLSWGRAMILWLAETLNLKEQNEARFEAKTVFKKLTWILLWGCKW